MGDDPREAAARYRLDRASRENGWTDRDAEAPASRAPAAGSRDPRSARGTTAADRAAFVETSIQQAIRRGDFDDLPGAGRPLPGMGESHDPDWWIRRKIQTEKLTGLGPPALMLRVEHAEMAERLDELTREDDVREAVADFNRRVIEARRQLRGGPPVVTPTHDVDDEVRAWHERRAVRLPDSAPSTSGDRARRRRWRWRAGRLR